MTLCDKAGDLALLTTASMQLHAAELGLSAADTAALLEQQDEQMLFIDVRDPVEIMFVGTPLGIDANIPFLMVDRHDFDADNNRFRLNQNPDFADQVAAALEAKGLDRDALIVTLCRSGSERGEPSANYLLEQGFSNTRSCTGCCHLTTTKLYDEFFSATDLPCASRHCH